MSSVYRTRRNSITCQCDVEDIKQPAAARRASEFVTYDPYSSNTPKCGMLPDTLPGCLLRN